MILAAALAVTSALPALAQSRFCEAIAMKALEAAERRDRGLDQSPLDAEIGMMLGLNTPAAENLVRVFRAMRRDIEADRTISPRQAYVLSRNAPCGWPGASPRGNAADQIMGR